MKKLPDKIKSCWLCIYSHLTPDGKLLDCKFVWNLMDIEKSKAGIHPDCPLEDL